MALAAVGLHTYIWNNQLRSIFLLLGFPFLLVLLLWMFCAGMSFSEYGRPDLAVQAGWDGVMQYGHIAVMAAGLWFVIAYFFYESMIAAATGARKVTREEYPEIYNLLENLCISRGLTMPSFQIIDSPQLNAFASGLTEKQACITLTTGIIEALPKDELEAVIGHELTHIINRDARLMVIAIIFAGMFSFLAHMFWRNMFYSRRDRRDGRMMLIAAIVLGIGYMFSIVIQFSLSRRREFLADAGSVELTKNPAAMMKALLHISGRSQMNDMNGDMRAMLLDDHSSGFMGLFATHPPIEDRIAAISAISGEPVPEAQRPVDDDTPHPWGRAS